MADPILEETEDDLDSGEEEQMKPAMTPAEASEVLIEASKAGNMVDAQAAVDAGAVVIETDDEGWSALHWAAFNGHHEIVAMLIKVGAAEGYRRSVGAGGEGESHAASSAQQLPTGAIQAQRRKPANSPLNWSIVRGHVRVLWLLMRAGLSVNEVDERANSGLHLAAMRGDEDILRTVMSAGVFVNEINLLGHKPSDLASTPQCKALLLAAERQTECPETQTEFGPENAQYLCSSTGQFYSDEGSTPLLVPAFPTGPVVLKPVRVTNRVEYQLQEAHATLLAAFRPASAADAMKRRAEGHLDGNDMESFGAVGILSPGAGAAALMSVVEDDEDEEEDEEEEEEEGEAGNSGFPSPLQSPIGRAAPTDAQSINGVEEALEEEEEVRVARVEAGWELEELDDEHREPLVAAIHAVEDLNGNCRLVQRAQQALKRLDAWLDLKGDVDAVTEARPLPARAPTQEAAEQLPVAEEAGVSARRLQWARDQLAAAVAEVALAGALEVCRGIGRATHANDGDMLRLTRAVGDAEKRGTNQADLLRASKALLARLDGEVALDDRLEEAESAVAAVKKAAVVHREADPTLLPPPPPPEEEEGDGAAAAAGGGKGSGRAKSPGGKKGSARSAGRGDSKGKGKAPPAAEEEEEPLPPLYPTPQLKGIEVLDGRVASLKQAVVAAREAGADEELVERVDARTGEMETERTALWEDEIARIRVFEAEKKKREKKKKKGKKKKK